MVDDIQISILGRNEIVREGLKRILTDQDFTVQATGSDHSELSLQPHSDLGNHVIIVDSTTDAEDPDTCRQLREMFPSARIVLMAEDYSIDNIARAFAAGVDGYLVKAISCGPLVGALRLIALGEKVVPSQIVDSLLDPVWRSPSGDWEAGRAGLNLSDREIEILRCLISGDANKVISRRLSITEATVKVHIKAILRKLHVMNRTQAAIWAVTRGLVADESSTVTRLTRH